MKMKILDINQFVSERMKIVPITNDELDKVKSMDVDKMQPRDPSLRNWGPNDFVRWDEAAYYWCHDYRFVDRNREKCDREGVPEDCRCSICQKEIKKGYKTLYWKSPTEEEYMADGRDSSSRWYAVPGEDREPTKVCNTCFKSFIQAHKKIYGK